MSDIAQDLGGVVLLPCPFCGYDMTDEDDGVYQKAGFTGAQTPVWEVCCGATMCNASVTATSREFAIAAWNTRANSAEIAGALRDAERYRWLRMMAKEQLLNPKAAGSEWPDMRTYWRIPTLICSGPVGGFIDLDTAIDSAMQQGGGGGE